MLPGAARDIVLASFPLNLALLVLAAALFRSAARRRDRATMKWGLRIFFCWLIGITVMSISISQNLFLGITGFCVVVAAVVILASTYWSAWRRWRLESSST